MTPPNELLGLTIAAAARLLAAREIAATELLDAVLGAIETFDPVLNTYRNLRRDAARAEAATADREIRAGRHRGPLHGIPMAVKDNIAVAGMEVTLGSRAMEHHRVDFDATVVQRLKSAGAVIVGTNNMHEWAMGGTCTRMYYGTVRNPWDPRRVPGGSSGGGGAAVSAGLAFAALGNDGWGSIRTPASYCGVVGVKPSFGAVSRYGVLPPSSAWIGDVGPITKDVADAAIVLGAIAGHDPADPTSRHAPVGWDVGQGGSDPDLRGCRIAVPTAFFWDDVVPEVRSAFHRAVATLRDLGADVRIVPFPSLDDLPLTLPATIAEPQGRMIELALTDPEAFAVPETRYRVLASTFISGVDMVRATQVRNRLRATYRRFMEDVDILLTPTNSTPAFEIDSPVVPLGPDLEPLDISLGLGRQGRVTTRLTLPFNILGLPAMSAPAGLSSDGLPIGLQFVAAPWQEQAMLGVAAAYEAAAGFGYRRPGLRPASEGPG